MKILFIGTYLEDKIGETRSYIHQIIKVLEYENDINVISLYDKKNIQKFKHINCKGSYLKFILVLLKNYFISDKVIWSHASLSLFYLPLSIINNSKNYLIVHGVEICGPNVKKLRIFLCSRFSNYVGHSNYTIQKIKKHYSSNKKKYYYLNHEKYSYKQFKNYAYKIFIYPKIIFFYKNLIQTGGAENLLVNTYKIFSKKYFCEVVTCKNNLFFDMNIIVKNNFFNLLIYMYLNKKNSVIIGSSGILNLFLISLIIFKKFYYHIHQPSIFSYNETDKHALNNFANIKFMYKNLDMLNDFTSKHNSFNSYERIMITFKYFLRKNAFLFAKKTFVLSNLAKIEKKILYNIDSKVIRGGINKDFEIFKKYQNLYNSKYINIVSLSRLVNDKRILETINAVHYSNNKNIKLYIYGSGNKEMEIVKHLESLNNRNIIFKGFLKNDNKKEVLSSADYLISLGAADFNLTVIEALYLKTKVILSDEFFYEDTIFNKEVIMYTSIEKERLINFFNKLQKNSLKEEDWKKVISYIKKELTWEAFSKKLEKEIS